MNIKSIFGMDKNKGKKKNAKKKADVHKGVQPSAAKAPSLSEHVIEILTSKEAISIFSILVFMILVLSSVFISPRAYQREMQEGDISLKDIYASYDFSYYWEVDKEKTTEARENASKAVLFLVRRNAEVGKNTGTRLEKFFDTLEEVRTQETSPGEKISILKEKTAASVEDKNLRVFLKHEDVKKLREGARAVLDNILLIGFIDSEDLEYLKKEGITDVALLNEKDNTEISRTSGAFLTKGRIPRAIDNYTSKEFAGDRKTQLAIRELVISYMEPNLKLDEKTTSSRREAAFKKTPPVYYKWAVKKNELIVAKGQRVNARHMAQLAEIRSVFREGRPTAFFLGIMVLFLLLFIVAAIYMKFTQRVNLLHKPKELAIVLINMLFIIVVADFIVRGPQPSYFIPLASTGMIITLMIGFSPAILSTVLMSILIAVLAGGKVEVVLVLLIGSMIGMYAVRSARRRATILWAGLLVGAAKFLAVIAAGLINGIEMQIYLKDGLWGIGSGVVSAFIVLGLLPVFEHLFKIPTDISLLELSDLNHPLLKELAIEAPGTYHHSILVGNLAEAACDSIGANSLLARVGSYYHDIGKSAKASYFSENEMSAGSKHENLKPSMSALIISKHVKNGLEMAKKHKLNSALLDFIAQHHGDSLISFFYQKAIEKSESGKVLNEDDFRYPGPKPQTKETAIVLLADTVEAASRTLDEPTPSSINNLVKKVINNKFIDEQLDECDLTLRDIHNIADSFVRVLMGVFHTRLNYPEDTGEKGTNVDKNKLRKSKQKKKD